MLNHYIDRLETAIYWARYEDDIDILFLARERMDQLLALAQTLPRAEQIRVHRKIDQVLPMEWPLWMEACRYEDSETAGCRGVTLH